MRFTMKCSITYYCGGFKSGVSLAPDYPQLLASINMNSSATSFRMKKTALMVFVSAFLGFAAFFFYSYQECTRQADLLTPPNGISTLDIIRISFFKAAGGGLFCGLSTLVVIAFMGHKELDEPQPVSGSRKKTR